MPDLRRKHPRLYAARHVVKTVAGIVVPLLGIGALVAFAVPSISLPDLPFPSLPRPDLDPPGWARYVKWVVLIAIAVGIGVRELRNRDAQLTDGAGGGGADPASDR